MSLTIEGFSDKNKLEEWPLGQLVLKAHHLKYLKIADLRATDDNKTQLLEFAAQVVTLTAACTRCTSSGLTPVQRTGTGLCRLSRTMASIGCRASPLAKAYGSKVEEMTAWTRWSRLSPNSKGSNFSVTIVMNCQRNKSNESRAP